MNRNVTRKKIALTSKHSWTIRAVPGGRRCRETPYLPMAAINESTQSMCGLVRRQRWAIGSAHIGRCLTFGRKLFASRVTQFFGTSSWGTNASHTYRQTCLPNTICYGEHLFIYLFFIFFSKIIFFFSFFFFQRSWDERGCRISSTSNSWSSRRGGCGGWG